MTIPNRFREAILKHAFAVPALPGYPLILAIEGPPGDGKSFSTATTLDDSGFTVFRISGANLSGSLEGQSVAALKSAYHKAGKYFAAGGDGYPALLVEDFDLSPAGESAGRRYTVNSQLLTGYMMNLADDVAMGGADTEERFPIFLTGNNFSVLHGPLTRPGRMEFFTWQPTADERAKVVFSIVEPWLSEPLTEKDAYRLSEDFENPLDSPSAISPSAPPADPTS